MQLPLVIGFEDSAEGSDALALGAQLAQALDARPLIASVATIPEGVLSLGELMAGLRTQAEDRLAGALKQLAAQDPEGQVVAGSSAARALHELAESRSAVAAVVGSSDRGALGRLIPGSTAERLLHGAPAPSV